MPISILSKIPGQAAAQTPANVPGPHSNGVEAHPPSKSPTRLAKARIDARPDGDVFNNGQRLVVVIGSEKRMIKII